MTDAHLGPGLDVDALRALRGRNTDHSALLARIEEHLGRHDGYVAFSGGKDSTVVLHLARQVDPAVPVAWFDSGLEFPETRDYIDQLATTWRLNLSVIKARPTALETLIASGAWDHDAPDQATPDLHTALITAPAALAHQLHGPGELWGVRSAEARGRRLLYAGQLNRQIAAECHGCCPTGARPTRQQRQRHGGVIARVDGTTAYGPIWDWTTPNVWEYLAAQRVPANPIYTKLRRLGAPEQSLRVAHVIDANQLEAGRVTWLRRGWPQLYADLLDVLPRLAEFV